MSNNALVVLLTWDRVVPWKVLSLPKRLTDDFMPVAYGSKSTVFRGRAREGSTLWVVTRPEAGGVRTPTLVARLKVKGLYTREDCPASLRTKGVEELLCKWGWVAIGDAEESEFFELNDASRALKNLGITSLSVMRSFPGETRRVAAAFGTCMRQARDRTVFLSYTHAESGSFAMDLAVSLLEEGFSPWLDALAIPRYDLDRTNVPTGIRLGRLIRIGILRSRLAVVVATEEYGNTHWTRKERRWIRERCKADGKFGCVQVLRGARKLKACAKDFESDSARDLAREIAAWRR